MASKQKNLSNAKSKKNDEFYTQLTDIEKELHHYKEQFKDKVVYCNCDDPTESNFVKYFLLNFEHFELKKLIATHFSDNHKVYKLEYSGKEVYSDVEELLVPLSSSGDFRSQESIEFLKEADIVVTNPPFSLFREYLAQLIEYDKQFLIMSSMNAITYKETFKLIKENLLWLGYNNSSVKWFQVPGDYDRGTESSVKIESGIKYASMNNVIWFTNLDVAKRHEELTLYKKYKPEDYPSYDNYSAIEVSKVANIPMDYEGVMGVPITFLDKYNPDQFEIIWTTDRGGDGFLDKIKLPHTRYDAPVVDGKGIYKRILIKKKDIDR